MSKIGITLGVLILGSGVSLTGAYALGAFGYDLELTKTKLDNSGKEKDLREEIKREGCVQSLFGNVEEEKTISDVDSNSLTLTSGNDKPEGGCLVVNWDKGNGTTSGNHKVNFRFLWSMKVDKSGFVLFSTGESVDDSGSKKMQFQGVLYVLAEDDNGRGKITKKKEIDSSKNKKIEDEKFLKTSTDLKGMNTISNEEFWGLTSTSGKFTTFEAMDDDTRKNKSDEYFRGYWTWKKDLSKSEAHKGSKDFCKGWEGVFDNSPLKLGEKLTGVKGTGEKGRIFSSASK